MKLALIITSSVLALAWLPLAVRFNRGWKTRKNPVSLAICAAMLLFAYTNVLFAFAISGETSWRFFAIATHVFDAIVVVNFYAAFRWSDKKFENQRRDYHYSVPPTNSTSTPRGS
jgi:uncharacterized membrane protein